MITTVIFDFDGTLADTNQLIINSFKYIYKEFYDEEGNDEYIRSTFGETLKKTLTRDFNKFKYEDVLSKYKEYQIGRFKDEVTLYETVEDTLKFLESKNIKMGVVTSRMKKSTVDALKEFSINKYFDAVITADDVKKHKPDKEPIIKALIELDSTGEETIYIGDSKFDMECALNASVTPVLAGWQFNSEELARKYNIKFILKKMSDLKNIIK